MKKILHYLLNIQCFAEGGGDGGAAAGTGNASTSEDMGQGQEKLPHNIPEKYRNIYRKSAMRTTPAKGKVKAENVDTAAADTQSDNKENTTTTEKEETVPSQKKLSYQELIESEDYREEHERYIKSLFGKRMKKHDSDMAKANELLAMSGQKYGLDTKSPTFYEDLGKALSDDDSIYERYAEEHDTTVAEAKRIMGLERQLERAQKESQARREADEDMARINALKENGKRTKAEYPEFDLNTEMKNPQFARLAAVLGGDTTTAYRVVHHADIVSRAVTKATENATQAVAESVKANRRRPDEGGISQSTAQPTLPNFRSMNKQQLEAWAAEQRRLKRKY